MGRGGAGDGGATEVGPEHVRAVARDFPGGVLGGRGAAAFRRRRAARARPPGATRTAPPQPRAATAGTYLTLSLTLPMPRRMSLTTRFLSLAVRGADDAADGCGGRMGDVDSRARYSVARLRGLGDGSARAEGNAQAEIRAEFHGSMVSYSSRHRQDKGSH